VSEQLALQLDSAPATEAAGADLARAIIAEQPDSLCVFLQGELGAGKTTFARGFLRGCGHTGRVPSPTYTLVEPYDCGDYRVIHMDLYRLQDGAELEFLGIRELTGPGSILLVEWPERAAAELPNKDLEVLLKVVPEGRAVVLAASGTIGAAVLDRQIQSNR
jgi:tRNA threonylcarbamoyladenosine biosynthesis protein TsaE